MVIRHPQSSPANKWGEEELLAQIAQTDETRGQNEPVGNDHSAFHSRLPEKALLLLPSAGNSGTKTPEEMDQDALTEQLADLHQHEQDRHVSGDVKLSPQDREVLRQWVEDQQLDREWRERGGYF